MADQSKTKQRTKRVLTAVATLMVTGGAVLNMLAYRHAHAMMHFTDSGVRTNSPESLTRLAKVRTLLLGVNVPRPVTDLSPDVVSPGCRSISIESADGITLGAWYCDAGADTPLVALFHGYASEKACLRHEARLFLDLGVSVLLVDFRGSGESSESYTTVGFVEAEDVAAVATYARNELPHPSLVLFGQSMGAAAILRAVSEHDVTPDGVVVEAVFDTMLKTVRHRFEAMKVPSWPSAELLVFWGGKQAGFDGFRHNPVAYARSVACPILFMHGSDDPRATVEEGRRVFAAVEETGIGQFREFPSAGHESYAVRFPGEWSETVGEFLDRFRVRAASGE